MELYIQQEDFTHPGFFALFRQMMPPYDLLRVITRFSERLKIEGCHQSYYTMINRTIKERLYPFMVAYQRGIALEGQALLGGQERDRRTRVIRSKQWRQRLGGLVNRGSTNDTEHADAEGTSVESTPSPDIE